MTQSRYYEIYEPLLKDFLKEIESVNHESLPEPFLPVYGDKYDNANYKILFVGWETRNNTSLPEFVQECKIDIKHGCKRWTDEFHCQGFIEDNGPFWSFVKTFLSKFFGFSQKELDDYYKKDLYNEKVDSALRGFAWGNMDSIERFEVSAKQQGAKYEDWEKIKRASKKFDKAENLLKVFQPNLMIIVRWVQDDYSWLVEGLTSYSETEVMSDYIEYYFVDYTKTHIIWTDHPNSWRFRSLSIVEGVDKLIEILREKKVK